MTSGTGWPLRTLGEMSESIAYGYTDSATSEPVGPRFLRITDIQDGAVNWNTVPFCRCESSDLKRFGLCPGDIVFARTGATTGKSFLIHECPESAVFASYLIRVRPNSSVDPGYLARFFETPAYWSQITQTSSGTAQPGVNASKLERLQVPLPPLAEQKRIAAVLDKADDLRGKRRQALATLDTLLQSVFLDMFGDPVTNPKGLPVAALADVASVMRGKFTPRPRDDPQFYGGDIPFIQTGDVVAARTYVTRHRQTLNEKGLSVSKMFQPGTVAITIAANIGATAILTYPMCFPDSVVGIIPASKRALPEFVEMQLRFFRKKLEAAAPQTAQRNINLEVLRPLRVIVPPIADQASFVAIAKNAQQQAAMMESNASAFDSLFAALQSAAFTGTLFNGVGAGVVRSKTLAEANRWLTQNGGAAEKHAQTSTKRLIGRDSL